MTFILLLAVLAPLGFVILAIRNGFTRKHNMVARSNTVDSGFDTSSTGSSFPIDYGVLADSRGSVDASDSSSCSSSENGSDGGGGSCDSGGDSGGGGGSDSGGGGE
jgi:hypothetical protein